MVLLSLRNLNVRRLKKYYYRSEGTCKRMQGVNVQKVVLLLLTMFNSSEDKIKLQQSIRDLEEVAETYQRPCKELTGINNTLYYLKTIEEEIN